MPWAGRLGSRSGRLPYASGSVVTPAQDHFSKNVFGFHLPLFNLFPFSFMVASIDVPSTVHPYEPLDLREVRRRRTEQEWRRSTQ